MASEVDHDRAEAMARHTLASTSNGDARTLAASYLAARNALEKASAEVVRLRATLAATWEPGQCERTELMGSCSLRGAPRADWCLACLRPQEDDK